MCNACRVCILKKKNFTHKSKMTTRTTTTPKGVLNWFLNAKTREVSYCLGDHRQTIKLERKKHFGIYIDPNDSKRLYIVSFDSDIIPLSEQCKIKQVKYTVIGGDDEEGNHLFRYVFCDQRAFVFSTFELKQHPVNRNHLVLEIGGPEFACGWTFSASSAKPYVALYGYLAYLGKAYNELTRLYGKVNETTRWILHGYAMLKAAHDHEKTLSYSWVNDWIVECFRPVNDLKLFQYMKVKESYCPHPSCNESTRKLWLTHGFPYYGTRSIRSALAIYSTDMFRTIQGWIRDNGTVATKFIYENIIYWTAVKLKWGEDTPMEWIVDSQWIIAYRCDIKYLAPKHQIQVDLTIYLPKKCIPLNTLKIRLTEIAGTVTDIIVDLGRDAIQVSDTENRYLFLIDCSENKHDGRGGRDRANEEGKQQLWKESFLIDSTNREYVQKVIRIASSSSNRKFWKPDHAIKHVQIDPEMRALLAPLSVRVSHLWWLELLEQARVATVSVQQQMIAVKELVAYSVPDLTAPKRKQSTKKQKVAKVAVHRNEDTGGDDDDDDDNEDHEYDDNNNNDYDLDEDGNVVAVKPKKKPISKKEQEEQTKNRILTYLLGVVGDTQLSLYIRCHTIKLMCEAYKFKESTLNIIWLAYMENQGKKKIECDMVTLYVKHGLNNMHDSEIRRYLLVEFTCLSISYYGYDELKKVLVSTIESTEWKNDDLMLDDDIQNKTKLIEWAAQCKKFDAWYHKRKFQPLAMKM